MTSGVTRTLATAVMVFELTGQLGAALPVLVAVCTATQVGNLFNESIFDMMMRLRRLPFLRESDAGATDALFAADVMRTSVLTLDVRMSLADLAGVLGSIHQHSRLPLVQADESGAGGPYLLGTVRRADLFEVFDVSRRVSGVDLDEPNVLDFHAGLRPTRTTEAEVEMREVASGGLHLHRPSSTRLPPIPFNANPMQVSPLAPLSQITHLMAMLGVDPLLVTQRGRLLGLVARRDVIALLQNSAS
eukprot:NODE_2260_length_956_cov_79.598677_g1861_i0.p1 GENE.NODE_2260_length_956_cov_79.598677_g1861_i0~~NODE_2260_length_956_cov_79.598677_g1861_i0.p1  ORF type:complete len:246 (+),score=62.19 NODE_2260_length_956_cov_79.598677_g1861_i0:87-824(+)